MIKVITAVAAVVLAACAVTPPAAIAQTTYTTRPDVFGHGSRTERSDGVVYTTRPDLFFQGHSRTQGSDGSDCRTRPTAPGFAQFGTTTTCD